MADQQAMKKTVDEGGAFIRVLNHTRAPITLPPTVQAPQKDGDQPVSFGQFTLKPGSNLVPADYLAALEEKVSTKAKDKDGYEKGGVRFWPTIEEMVTNGLISDPKVDVPEPTALSSVSVPQAKALIQKESRLSVLQSWRELGGPKALRDALDTRITELRGA